MAKLSPLQKRILAASIFGIITVIFIGSTVYQTYFANPVDSLHYFGKVEPFTMPSVTRNNYTYQPTHQDVTIVTFMYTKCPGDTGCSLLSSNMAKLEDRIKSKGWSGVQLISIDFDYINDTMSDLRSYAKTYTDDFNFWQFLLGNENQTKEVADQFDFFFTPNNGSSITLNHAGEEHEDPYLHQMTTYFLDREGNRRKFIMGTNWDFDEVLDSIEFLLSSDWMN